MRDDGCRLLPTSLAIRQTATGCGGQEVTPAPRALPPLLLGPSAEHPRPPSQPPRTRPAASKPGDGSRAPACAGAARRASEILPAQRNARLPSRNLAGYWDPVISSPALLGGMREKRPPGPKGRKSAWPTSEAGRSCGARARSRRRTAEDIQLVIALKTVAVGDGQGFSKGRVDARIRVCDL